MPGEPQIIVSEIRDQSSPRMAQSLVSRHAGSTRICRQVHPVHARVAKGGDDRFAVISAAIAHNPDLKINEILPEDSFER